MRRILSGIWRKEGRVRADAFMNQGSIKAIRRVIAGGVAALIVLLLISFLPLEKWSQTAAYSQNTPAATDREEDAGLREKGMAEIALRHGEPVTPQPKAKLGKGQSEAAVPRPEIIEPVLANEMKAEGGKGKEIEVLIRFADSDGEGAAGVLATTASRIDSERTRMKEVAEELEKAGAKVEGAYLVGNLIVAKVKASELEKITENKKVEMISANREVQAVLSESVPQIEADAFWNAGFKGKGVRVAILDTGIDSSHPMLAGKVIAEKAFTGEDHTTDLNGHGTHVAGTVAGTKAAGGSYDGVAPDALLMNGKVLSDDGWGSTAGIVAGINWAVDPDGNPETDDGAKVISMSLGGTYNNPYDPMSMAIKEALEAGVLVIVASGNCGACGLCGGYKGVTTPGTSPWAFTVGAVDKSNEVACFSGGGVIDEVGVKPDITAPGVGIKSSVPGGYSAYQGTSMATPHVSGAAALLLQKNPALSPEQIRSILENTATDRGATGKDTSYGAGILNLSAAFRAKAAIKATSRISADMLTSEELNEEIIFYNFGSEPLYINVSHDSWIRFTGLPESPFRIEPTRNITTKYSIAALEIGAGLHNGKIEVNTSDQDLRNVSVSISIRVFESTAPKFEEVAFPALAFSREELELATSVTDNGMVSKVIAKVKSPENAFPQVETGLEKIDEKRWRGLLRMPLVSSSKQAVLEVTASDNDGHASVFEKGMEITNLVVEIKGSDNATQGKAVEIGAIFVNTADATKDVLAEFEIVDSLGITAFRSVDGSVNLPTGFKGIFSVKWTPESYGNYVVNVTIKSPSEEIMANSTESLTITLPQWGSMQSVKLPEAITKGEALSYEVQFGNSGPAPFEAIAALSILDEHQKVKLVVPSEEKEVPAGGSITFSASAEKLSLSGGNYTAVLQVFYGNREEVVEKPLKVTAPETLGITLGLAKKEVEYGSENLHYTVTARNTGAMPLFAEFNTTLRNSEGDEAYSARFNGSEVAAGESLGISSEINTTGLSVGSYLLTVNANYEGNSVNTQTQFNIEDTAPPLLGPVTLPKAVRRYEPIAAELGALDYSPLANISAKLITGEKKILGESNASPSRGNPVIFNTAETGKHLLILEACDAYNNCNTSENAITVEECPGRKALIINARNDQKTVRPLIEGALSSNACIYEYNTTNGALPDSSYLANFTAVIWTSGNSQRAVPQHYQSLLLDYILGGGSLLVEGADIAFRHRNDEFMRNITHSVLAETMTVSLPGSPEASPQEGKEINITRAAPHHITFALPETFSYRPPDQNRDPDEVLPLDEADGLLRWGERDGYAAVAYETRVEGLNITEPEGHYKTAFLPLDIAGLNGETAKRILADTTEWLLLESSLSDIRVEVTHGRLVEGDNEINLTITEKTGPATTAEVIFEVDKSKVYSQEIEMPEGSSTIRLAVPLTAGERTIRAAAIAPISEQDYKNNEVAYKAYVAPKLPDIIVQGIAYAYEAATQTAEINVTATNRGGTAAETDITVFIGDNATGTAHLNLQAGGEANRSFKSRAAAGKKKITAKSENAEDANYANNQLTIEANFCSKERILVVDDNDTELYATSAPSSAPEIARILDENGYCAELWGEAEKGLPTSLNAFPLVVWSTGDYLQAITSSEDAELIRGYRNSLLLEGSDIAADLAGRGNESLLREISGTAFASDVLIPLTENRTLNKKEHPILEGVGNLEIGGNRSPYPDAVEALDAEAVAEWQNANGTAAITARTVTDPPYGRKQAYYAFSVDGITDPAVMERLVLNTVQWLLRPNSVPQLHNLSDITVNEGENAFMEINATDADNDTLSYAVNDSRFVKGQQGQQQNANVFVWSASYNDAGNYKVLVSASDWKDSANATINVTVLGVNRPAVFNNTFENITTSENGTVVLKLVPYDADNDPLELEALMGAREVPQHYSNVALFGASFDSGSGTFVWTPDFNSSGEYVLRVDLLEYYISPLEGMMLRKLVNITVANSNRAPSFTFEPNDSTSIGAEKIEITMYEGQTKNFSVIATDPDSDTLAYTWLLNGAVVSTIQNFSFSPKYNESGDYNLTIIVSDGQAETKADLLITVLDVNRPAAIKGVLISRPLKNTASATAIIFDEFNDGSINSSIWIQSDWDGGVLVEADGALHFETGSSNDRQIRTKSDLGLHENFTIAFRIKVDYVSGDKNSGFWLGNLAEGQPSVSSGHRGYYWQFHGKTQGFNIVGLYDNNSSSLHGKYSPPNWEPGKWHDLKVERAAGVARFYFDGALVGTDSTFAPILSELYWNSGRTWKDPREGEDARMNVDDFSVSSTSDETDGSVTPDLVYEFINLSNTSEVIMYNNETGILSILAEDPDGDVLAYTWLLDGIAVSTSQNFTFAPEENEITKHNLTIIASDGKSETKASFILAVLEPPDCRANVDARLCDFQLGVCSGGSETCDSNGKWPGCTAATYLSYSSKYEAAETSCDGFDNDCNGQIDENRVCNTAPQLQQIENKTTQENSQLSFTAAATDNEGDSLTYNATNIPQGAAFDNATAAFSWAPTFEQSGVYTVAFNVSDGLLSDYETINVTVANVNRPPVFEGLANKTVPENSTLSFVANVADPDGDAVASLVVYVPQRLSNATLNKSTHEFKWTPSFDDSGTYQVTFSASDGQLSANASINITVLNVNRAPAIMLLLLDPPELVMGEGETKTFAADVGDVDNDKVAVTWKINGETASTEPQLTFSPEYDSSGTYTIELLVSDYAETTTTAMTLTVQDTMECEPLVGKQPCKLQQSVCKGSSETCSTGGKWLGCGAPTYLGYNAKYEEKETLCDGLDNNCDGLADEGFEDVDGDKIADCVDDDNDNDGVKDDVDEVIGDEGNVNTNVNDLKLEVGSGPDENKPKLREVRFKAGGNDLARFDVDFSTAKLNMRSIMVKQQSAADKKGYTIFGMAGAEHDKTLYVDRLSSGSNSVCVKDAEINDVAEINSGCTGTGEVLAICGAQPPSSQPTQLQCWMESGRFAVAPLKHSGVVEACWDVDGDGYLPAGCEGGMDCNDNDKALNPAAKEVCNGKDDDCDGAADEDRVCNTAPEFAATGSKEVSENAKLEFTVSATDKEKDEITYSASSLPKGASFDEKTAAFSWVPAYDQSGIYVVTFTVSDGLASGKEEVKITVLNVNRAPEIIGAIGNREVKENEELSFTVQAEDPDGDKLAWTVTYSKEPAGAKVEQLGSSLKFSWKPGFEQSGTYAAEFAASDGSYSASETITITALNVNRLPVIEHILIDPPGLVMGEGEKKTFTPTFSDADNDALTVSWKANGKTVSANDVLEFSTGYESSGEYTIVFEVNDGSATSSTTMALTVQDTLECEGSQKKACPLQQGVCSSSFASCVNGKFADCGGSASYGSKYIAKEEFCSFKPNENSCLALCDTLDNDCDGAADEDRVCNTAPKLQAIGEKSAKENELLTFTVSATDSDGDKLSFSASNLPQGSAFDASTATFSWKPAFDQAGTYKAKFAVTDGLLSAEEEPSITVANTNRAPAITGTTGSTAVKETEEAVITVSASDPDGDSLTYSVDDSRFANDNEKSSTFRWKTGYDDAGTHSVKVTVADNSADGTLTTSTDVTVKVENVNRPPVISQLLLDPANLEMNEGETKTFTPSLADDDGDALSATWMVDGNVASTEKVFTYKPGFLDSGEHTVELVASDQADAATTKMLLTVFDTMQCEPGKAAGCPLQLGVCHGSAAACTMDGKMPACGAADYSTAAKGSGSYAPTEEYCSLAPNENSCYMYCDGLDNDCDGQKDEDRVCNTAPQAGKAGMKEASEGKELEFGVAAEDSEGDTLAFSSSDLPRGAALAESGTLKWTPSYEQAGEYDIPVTVSDGLQHAAITVQVRVSNVNRAPEAGILIEPQGTEVKTGEFRLLRANAKDPDDDTLSYTWTHNGLLVSKSTFYKFAPEPTTGATHEFRLTASDGELNAEATAVLTYANTWVCNPGETRPCQQQLGVCAGSSETCASTGKWPECTAATYSSYSSSYQTSEVNCDNADNDCDGQVDEDIVKSCGPDKGTSTCAAGVWQPCSGSQELDKPIEEACGNGIDDNANGKVDEGCDITAPATTIYLSESPDPTKRHEHTYKFLIYAHLQASDHESELTGCEINWNDGDGWETADKGTEGKITTLNHSYKTLGQKKVEYRCTSQGGTSETTERFHGYDAIEIADGTPPSTKVYLGDTETPAHKKETASMKVYAYLWNWDSQSELKSCEIDWGEGTGWQAVDVGPRSLINFYTAQHDYAGKGLKHVSYRCTSEFGGTSTGNREHFNYDEIAIK
ncbi:tandem-95 repeat protein [Candidatus Woesearchaeota archaeon]|nr:tandem-95 repeat protein [Candidatus Woesearchaeota archaeon]